jgi:DNA-binding transcriptional LysR family regulator
METLANLEAFVRSAELGGFSAAARLLELTPAAVSRNVAMLERNLGVRLFHRSTRRLTLTEAGERFLQRIQGSLDTLQSAIADAGNEQDEPAGTLKVNMLPAFGIDHVLPLLPDFSARYPGVRIDWQFENRLVDLIGEGLDAAIGGGVELAQGIVARPLVPAHIVAVAAPAYLQERGRLLRPEQLKGLHGLMMRSAQSGRVHHWSMRNREGKEAVLPLEVHITFNEPEALCTAAELAMGIALVPLSNALARLEQGRLVRVLPQWHADAGSISLYYAHRTLLPAKTRCFIEYLTATFQRADVKRRFSAL